MKEQKHLGMGKEFPHTDQILALSAVLFFAVWILDSFVFRLSDRFVGFVSDIIRIAFFIGLEVSAIVLGFYSHESLFCKKRAEFTLITDGVFAHVRHPLYLSILLAYLGFFFGSMSLISLIPWICYAVLFDKMANYEEEDLVRIFGDKYIEYRKRVPKWFPISLRKNSCEINGRVCGG
jgi:protein-S-isoprenylcysteine O-methyltransferase Ste14